jgi:hypothetical protein
MRIKTFFMILAVLVVIHGIGFVIVPDQVASAYGLANSASTLLTAQLFGGALLAWGVRRARKLEATCLKRNGLSAEVHAEAVGAVSQAV